MIPRFDFVIVMQGDTPVSEPIVLETPDGPYVRISDLSPAVLTLMQHLDRVGSMNKETAQKVINEIKEICDKYGVVLYGTCEDEGIYGEIAIRSSDEPLRPWETDLSDRINNRVRLLRSGDFSADFYATGIGGLIVESEK